MLIVSQIIAWGLTRVMKDVKSTYVDRAMHCGAIPGANISTL